MCIAASVTNQIVVFVARFNLYRQTRVGRRSLLTPVRLKELGEVETTLR